MNIKLKHNLIKHLTYASCYCYNILILISFCFYQALLCSFFSSRFWIEELICQVSWTSWQLMDSKIVTEFWRCMLLHLTLHSSLHGTRWLDCTARAGNGLYIVKLLLYSVFARSHLFANQSLQEAQNPQFFRRRLTSSFKLVPRF